MFNNGLDNLAASREESLNHAIEDQQRAVDFQRKQAEEGLDNTLATEEKKEAELQRRRKKEAQNLKRVKELEAFLTAVVEFNKEDPKTAIIKALGQVAGIEAASAIFAEEGGLLGTTSKHQSRVMISANRRHKTGGDILVHAQKGEGLLSTKEIDNLGGPSAFLSFKDMLSSPMDKPIKVGVPGTIAGSDTYQELLGEVTGLRKDLKSQPRQTMDIDKLGNLIVTTYKDGVKNTVKLITKKEPGF